MINCSFDNKNKTIQLPLPLTFSKTQTEKILHALIQAESYTPKNHLIHSTILKLNCKPFLLCFGTILDTSGTVNLYYSNVIWQGYGLTLSYY